MHLPPAAQRFQKPLFLVRLLRPWTSKLASIIGISCSPACKHQASGPHHQHQLHPRSLDTGIRASIMSINARSGSGPHAASASAAAPLPGYRQPGQHHRHQLQAGLQAPSHWPASSARTPHRIAANGPASCKSVLWVYRRTCQHHEHQLQAGLQARSPHHQNELRPLSMETLNGPAS